jgi:transcription antitermination factor NusB
MRTRTISREAALQYLYEVDMVGAGGAEDLASFLERQVGRPEARDYARLLAEGALARRGEIDSLVATASKNWSLKRMSVVDRNILRLGAFELVFAGTVPPKVAINEAIDLARRFSTEEACAFVNGMLDSIRISVAGEAGGGPAAAEPTGGGATGRDEGEATAEDTGVTERGDD